MTADFLFELGCEELPARFLPSLQQALRDGVCQGLAELQLTFAEVKAFVTPRRLALLLSDCQLEQAQTSVQRRGPAVAAAYGDDGQPTPAALGFAKSCGVEITELETLTTDKGEWLVYQQEQPGKHLRELLPTLLTKVIKQLPIPKTMRWGEKSAEFLRPVRWLVMMLGSEVIEAEILGVKSQAQSYGHRFHHPDAVTLSSAADYAAQLRQAYVIVDAAERADIIRRQALALAQAEKLHAVITDELLTEVCGLVEWPVPLLVPFAEEFLRVPAEALIAAMRDHQKCFHVTDDNEQLQAYFITVSNIESRDPQRVIQGNQRVMFARLADAAFFYDSDKQQTLAARLPQLEKVAFQAQLGSLADKSRRVTELAVVIGKHLQAELTAVQRGAELAKCDLMSDMVGEFPELQGIMGKYYAQHDGESESVAAIIEQHYWPRFAADNLPQTREAASVALAERFDTLTGIFGIGMSPSGTKDPFSLRRAALGIVRIIHEFQASLELPAILDKAITAYGDKLSNADVANQVQAYILERLKAWYNERGVSHGILQAVLARQSNNLADVAARIRALEKFAALPAANALAAANKRVSKILSKAEVDGIADTVNEVLLAEPAEQALASALQQVTQASAPLLAKQDYNAALEQFAQLREPVDDFFDNVMVMADELELRHNRLALLTKLRQLFLQIADISLL